MANDFSDINKNVLGSLHDAHCHIIELPLKPVKVGKLILQSSQVADWEKVTSLNSTDSKFIPSYGIHPWFLNSNYLEVEGVSKDSVNFNSNINFEKFILNTDIKIPYWINQFIDYLIVDDSNMVGEIGLDKVATDPNTKQIYDFEKQVDLFLLQLQLAANFDKAVSIHCVASINSVVEVFKAIKSDILKEDTDSTKKYLLFPPKLVLHSFSGSSESLKLVLNTCKFSNRQAKILKSRNTVFKEPEIYFSFSKLVNFRYKFLDKVILSLPLDSLLIESDCANGDHVDDLILEILNYLVNILKMDENTLVRKLISNFNNLIKK